MRFEKEMRGSLGGPGKPQVCAHQRGLNASTQEIK